MIQKEFHDEAYNKEVACHDGNDEFYGFSNCTKSIIRDTFIANPFDKTATKNYLNKMSPNEMTSKKKQPSFWIDFDSLTVDVGPFDEKD